MFYLSTTWTSIPHYMGTRLMNQYQTIRALNMCASLWRNFPENTVPESVARDLFDLVEELTLIPEISLQLKAARLAGFNRQQCLQIVDEKCRLGILK